MPENYTQPCPGQEEAIYLYLDDALPSVARSEFLEHLDSCQICQTQLAETQALFTELAQWAPVPLPSNEVETAAAEIMAQLPVQSRVAEELDEPYWLLGAQFLVGLILLLALLPSFAGRSPDQLRVPLSLDQYHILLLFEAGRSTVQILIDRWTSFFRIDLWQFDLIGLNISFEAIIVAIIICGFAWLIGNIVLLAGPSRLFNDGGTSS